METQRPFFVYGTLLPGQPNAYLWEGLALAQMGAVLPHGRLYDLGHYPMLVAEPGHQVQGALLSMAPEAYAVVIERLDDLEGYTPDNPEACPYHRVARDVLLGNGRVVTAWVYLGHSRHTAGHPPVPAGDWAAYVAAKNQKPGLPNHVNSL